MRKIFSLIIMVFFLLMTVYVSFVWEPNEDLNNNIKYEDGNNKEVNNDKDEVDIRNEYSQKNSIATSNLQILKMPIDEVLEDLSYSDKVQLSYYVYKIQEVDRKRIIDWLRENSLEGYQNAYSLIQTRLTSEDFIRLSSIIEPYVNIDLLKIKV